MNSLDIMFDPDSEVRLLDDFVDWAMTHNLGFKNQTQLTVRPPFLY